MVVADSYICTVTSVAETIAGRIHSLNTRCDFSYSRPGDQFQRLQRVFLDQELIS